MCTDAYTKLICRGESCFNGNARGMHQKCSQKEAPVQRFLKDLVKGSKYLKCPTWFHSVSSMHQNFTLFLKNFARDLSFLTDTPITVFFE